MSGLPRILSLRAPVHSAGLYRPLELSGDVPLLGVGNLPSLVREALLLKK